MFRVILLIVSSFFYHLESHYVGAIWEEPYTSTDGEYLKAKKKIFFNGEPFHSQQVERLATCPMIFIYQVRANSMNVVEKGPSKIECQLFESKADGDRALTVKDGSTYIEKIENFFKATSSIINVEARDDKPGSFGFQLPTGSYKIRLNHLSGGFVYDASRPIKMPFGGFGYNEYFASLIVLVTGFRGNTIVEKHHFTEWEGNGSKTKFLATSKCFHLDQNYTYSFWYGSDLHDYEEADKYGKSSFEMFVQLCEH